MTNLAAPATALPTTSYAVLGMLAIRSWTGYELTQQMRRGLDYCWPKAESVLYDEPRRLVTLGLARARREREGRRTRTRYEITAAGRRALRQWLGTEPAAPKLEVEPLLRLLYADQGTVEDALAAVKGLRAWAEEHWERGYSQIAGYLDDGGPFPERLHINALFARYFGDLLEATITFAKLAEREIATWDRTDGLGMTPGARTVLEELAGRHRKT